MERYDSRGEGLMRTHHSHCLVFDKVELKNLAPKTSIELQKIQVKSHKEHHLVIRVSAPNGQRKHCHFHVLYRYKADY